MMLGVSGAWRRMVGEGLLCYLAGLSLGVVWNR